MTSVINVMICSDFIFLVFINLFVVILLLLVRERLSFKLAILSWCMSQERFKE